MKLRFRISPVTQKPFSTLHCALENGADLRVNERQKIDTIALGLLKKEEELEEEERRRRMPNRDFFTSHGAYVNLRYIAMLYTYSIGNQP